jgi:transposase-like protein
MGYSNDRRQAALRQVRAGKTRREGARMLAIGEATVYRWRKNAGRRNGTPGPQAGRQVPQAALRETLAKRPDATLPERGRACSVDPTTLCHVCRTWQSTRKKNVGVRRAGRYEKQGVPPSS